MQRQLVEMIGTDNLTGGVVFALFLGVFYMLGAIYTIYAQYLNTVIFNIFSLVPDGVKPLLFPFLHSLLFLILNFFSTMSSRNDLGLATIIGSDAFVVLLFTGYASIRYATQKQIMTLDPWVTFQDALSYIVVLLCVTLFLLLDWMNLYSAIILLALGIIYLIVLVYTDEIKEQIEDWLSLNDEEQEYSSDEHFHCRRRRESSSQLKSMGCFDPSDLNLQKKLNRMEALLVIKFGTNAQDHPQKRLYATFQKSVYQIIFAIRNRARNQKMQRVEMYNELYTPKIKRKGISRRSASQPNDILQPQQKEIEQVIDDKDPLIQSKDLQSEPNFQRKEGAKLSRKERVDEKKFLAPVSKEVPDQPLAKLLHFMYLPIIFILLAFPSVNVGILQRSYMLCLCLFLGLAMTTGALFLIDWWLLEISIGSTIPIEILGMIFAGIMLGLHLNTHVTKLVDSQTEIQVVQLFFQVAVMKLTICISIPQIIQVIASQDLELHFRSNTGFDISVGVLLGCVLIFMVISVFSRFRFGQTNGIMFVVLYACYAIVAIVLISIYV